MSSNIIKKDRIVYFDYLRIVAIVAVMLVHISSQNWYMVGTDTTTWQVFNVFDSISRWGVPVFVMISGALFLNREISVKTVYKKYILRLVIAFVVWSIVYALFGNSDVIKTVGEAIRGHYHMWFILMIIGLYMCIPIFKEIVKSNKVLKYFLMLSLVFVFIFPTLNNIVRDFTGEMPTKIFKLLNENVNDMQLNLVLGYSGYFVLGYYLNNIDLSKKQRRIIYILGIVGFVLTISLSAIVSLKTNQPTSTYYNNLSILVLLESIAVFTLFKHTKFENIKLNNIIAKLSKYSFGVYLVHALILEQVDELLGFNTLMFNPVLSIICVLLVVGIISFIISFILNHIPVLKKYIV